MKCFLCLENRKLSNSHIVPDFIFKKLQGTDREFHALYTDGRAKQTFHRTFSQKLLCSDCENLFSCWEGYASQIFYGGMPLAGRQADNILQFKGIDYPQMKLFFMSLLWRFAITTNPWFKGMKLGPHQERLRLMLKSSDPGEFWQYGCLVTAVMNKGRHFSDLIVPPSPCSHEGARCQRIVVGGFLLIFFVSSHKPGDLAKFGLLKPSGDWLISIFEMKEIAFLAEMAKQMSTK